MDEYSRLMDIDDEYSRLMDIDEVTEYLNNKTARVFNKDKTLKFINEKKIPIVFDYEGRGTWEFRAESGWKSHHIQVKGYFNFRNRNDAVQLFKGFLEEIDLEEAIIYKLKTAPVLKNVSDDIKPKKGDDILFETGESSTIFSNQFNSSDSQNSIKIDNSKVGVLKEDLEEYLNKVQTEYMNSKTKIETLEAEIEKLKAENASLIQQHIEASTVADVKVKHLEQDIDTLNAQLNEQTDKYLYNWQGMNQYTYPPELHLAMIIWRKIYVLNEIENRHITDHSQRFNIIAEKIGLDKGIHGTALISRLGKITNPQINKQKGDIENLKVIKELNIKDLDDSNPQG